MKISKMLLQTMIIALASGTIASCKKPILEEIKKSSTEKKQQEPSTDFCPACGMG